MKFGIDAILDSFETSFDLKKLVYQLAGFIIALIGFVLFSWLGSLPKNDPGMIIGTLLGVIFLYSVLMLTSGAVCRMIYQESSAGKKITAREAMDFARSKAAPLILSPVVLILLLIVLGIVEYLIAKIGGFPVGDIILSLLTAPLILINLIALLALFYGMFLTAAIVAAEESGVMDTVGKIYTAVRQAPLHLITYTALAWLICWVVLLGVIGTFVGSVIVTAVVFAPVALKALEAMSTTLDIPLTIKIAGVLAGLSVGVMAALVLSYPMVVFQGISTTIYLAIKERLK